MNLILLLRALLESVVSLVARDDVLEICKSERESSRDLLKMEFGKAEPTSLLKVCFGSSGLMNSLGSPGREYSLVVAKSS
jgi:hypothetical protein